MEITLQKDFMNAQPILTKAEKMAWIQNIHDELDRYELQELGDRPFTGSYNHSIGGAIKSDPQRRITDVKFYRGLGWGG